MVKSRRRNSLGRSKSRRKPCKSDQIRNRSTGRCNKISRRKRISRRKPRKSRLAPWDNRRKGWCKKTNICACRGVKCVVSPACRNFSKCPRKYQSRRKASRKKWRVKCSTPGRTLNRTSGHCFIRSVRSPPDRFRLKSNGKPWKSRRKSRNKYKKRSKMRSRVNMDSDDPRRHTLAVAQADPQAAQYRRHLTEQAREYGESNTLRGIVPPVDNSWQTQFLNWWVKKQRARGVTEKQIRRLLLWFELQPIPETHSWMDEVAESWANRHREEGTLTEEQIRAALGAGYSP